MTQPKTSLAFRGGNSYRNLKVDITQRRRIRKKGDKQAPFVLFPLVLIAPRFSGMRHVLGKQTLDVAHASSSFNARSSDDVQKTGREKVQLRFLRVVPKSVLRLASYMGDDDRLKE